MMGRRLYYSDITGNRFSINLMKPDLSQILAHISCIMGINNIDTTCTNGLRNKFCASFLTLLTCMLASIRDRLIFIPGHNASFFM